MKVKKIFMSLVFVLVATALVVSMVSADDGVMFRKNVSKTPDAETERANINHMAFYVPAQAADGTLLTEGINYLIPVSKVDDEGNLITEEVIDNRLYAKPLVGVYIDSYHEEEDVLPEDDTALSILTPSLADSGSGLGQHDAYAALSLDDGATWKRTNLSLSADLSSFDLDNGTPYPGDAHNMTFAIAGDKVLVGWISKYCDGGSASYTFSEEKVDALQAAFGLPDLYVRDIWGVAGTQNSVDYEQQGFPEVGQIPYSCVWSARGQLLQVEKEFKDEDGNITYETIYDIVWTKAERLTSGRRDANRLEMNADSAAGFMMTWQEDPEGLRPGMGLGPGEGWSGAVVNQQTDLWYSFISIENFDWVLPAEEEDPIEPEDDTEEPPDYSLATPLAEYTGETMPKAAVPMAMPLRLTDNKKCMVANGDGGTEEQQFLYCFVDFDDVDPYNLTDLSAIDFNLDTDGDDNVDKPFLYRSDSSTYCSSTVEWTPPGMIDDDPETTDPSLTLCVAEDGRVLGGRVGASRPRVNVQPYNSAFVVDTAIDLASYDGGIVIMGAEESKALGEGAVDDTDGDEVIEPEDIGKNMWYYSFDLANPSFVLQGGMLNQPAVCGPQDVLDVDSGCTQEGDFFPLIEDDFGNFFYETEISRRFSHMSQPIHQFGPAGISSVLIVKQGILNQGGPADIFLRLTQVPDDVWVDCDGDETTLEKCLPEGYNPYAYQNLVCEDLDGSSGWEFTGTDETTGLPENPRYIEGLCTSTMINVSGTNIDSCDNLTSGTDCAATFPWDGMKDDEDPTFPKVTTWSQSGPNYGDPLSDTNIGNLDDQSWENPFDVAKGHRGFIDGDFIMMMYAWSPNWQSNSVGNDHYNLYARRSFDGGKTWTTLPSSYTHADGSSWTGDGTETCENFKITDDPNTPDVVEKIDTVCTEYGAGKFEQARNLSQLIGNRETILDPRYTPTGGLKMLPITDLKEIGWTGYEDDVRDPSKFFIVYETGDNTTVAEGEAVPLDLFYSRATNWGDDYFLVEYPPEVEDGDDVEITWGFDWLEKDREFLSGEAANTCNNGGTFYYVIWNQWMEDAEENVSNSDAIFRRVMFLPDDADTSLYPPVATLLYANDSLFSWEADDQILLVATAKVFGTDNGLVEFEWIYTAPDGTVYPLGGYEKVLSTSVRNLPGWAQNPGQPGWANFSFRAKDKNDNWSNKVDVKVYIAEETFEIFTPLVVK